MAVYQRCHPRPQLRPFDRLFWVWLSKVWGQWLSALLIVKPETVIQSLRKNDSAWKKKFAHERISAHLFKVFLKPKKLGPALIVAEKLGINITRDDPGINCPSKQHLPEIFGPPRIAGNANPAEPNTIVVLTGTASVVWKKPLIL